MCGFVSWRNLPASVVDDVLYDAPDVTIAFCKVEVAQTGRRFIVVGMRLELDSNCNTSVIQLYC